MEGEVSGGEPDLLTWALGWGRGPLSIRNSLIVGGCAKEGSSGFRPDTMGSLEVVLDGWAYFPSRALEKGVVEILYMP